MTDELSAVLSPVRFGGGFHHPFDQAARTHNRSNFLNEFETFGFHTGLPRVLPAIWVIAVDWPGRVLSFVIYDNF